MKVVRAFQQGLLLGLVGLGACGRSPAPPTEPEKVASAAEACEQVSSDHTHVPKPAPGATSSARAPLAKHVIILSEDGMRPDALVRAGAKVHEDLMREAAYTLRAKTIRQASTLPSHAAMLSGFDVEEHGLDWNSWRPERGFIRVPTVLSAAVAAGKGAAAFVGKWKLKHITEPGTVDVFSRPGYLCKKVVEEASTYFVEKKPQVLFVHFSDPDEEGHSVGWMSEPQLKAIRTSDKCLGTLLDTIRGAEHGKDTLLIISSDHGGHGRNHSGAIEEDRLIPWVVVGPKVKAGYRIKGRVSTVDTAATALWALGYDPPPGLQGQPVTEAFELP